MMKPIIAVTALLLPSLALACIRLYRDLAFNCVERRRQPRHDWRHGKYEDHDPDQISHFVRPGPPGMPALALVFGADITSKRARQIRLRRPRDIASTTKIEGRDYGGPYTFF
jgi:hypothetical protein